MNEMKMKPILKILLLFLMAGTVFMFILPAAAESAVSAVQTETARPSVNGKLHVQGQVLADESGKEVQLRGVSTHGLTWYPEYIEDDFIKNISEDWNCNMLRLAMYTEVYCGEEKEESLALLRKGIEAAVKADMYVLVDWHILNDNDPNINKTAALEFFELISQEYADVPNVIYEICNEPNGETDWSDVVAYSNEIIPVIRSNSPDSVIVVGTPEYDRNLGDPLLRPLDFDNVMYVLHFYTATHHEGLRGELDAAYEAGLPVFISECGISEASGDGTVNFESAAEWFSYLKERNISYAVWSLSNKDESSAFFGTDFVPDHVPEEKDLTRAGRWIRELIRGADPKEIPYSDAVVEKDGLSRFRSWISDSLGPRGYAPLRRWKDFALISFIAALLAFIAGSVLRKNAHGHTYDDIYGPKEKTSQAAVSRILLLVSSVCTVVYLCWRIFLSIPVEAGVFAVIANLVLLAVEILGFAESLVMYENMMGMRSRPLPEIRGDEYPDVDIFIATYNEPEELLRKTINGCVHLKYPDPSKVHVWICDDNRRASMKALAAEMGVGYFDRPDNSGAKAGNLNAALARTCAPLVVTLDADMIVKSDFLLKTIPYFVDAENRNRSRDEKDQIHLGLLQTPQAFYDPDVFQHALYSEKRAPNEQDFFYRTIEVAKTASNSVIYGGSNTVLSRKALEEIGGFFTGSITEDFATGLLIESAGYVSLGLGEPLASGQTPHEYSDHIKQRQRWGRGVISTARQLKIFTRKGLTLSQKINYWSSVIYWYSPIKNMIYMISPLLFAAFALPVFRCSWLELLVYWLPMYILQDVTLRYISRNSISLKWSGIYETSVMVPLFMPVLKESLGITMSAFRVTDKSRKAGRRTVDIRSMAPYLFLTAISLAGIIRVFMIMNLLNVISLLILLFWLVRNLYFLIMTIFLIDGRDSDSETVRVRDAEPAVLTVSHGADKGRRYEGITAMMTEHKVRLFLDEGESLKAGTPVTLVIDSGEYRVQLTGAVTDVHLSASGRSRTHTVEILDFNGTEYDYLCLLYDRVPTLPQSLQKDFGIIRHLWQNIAHRVARTRM